MKEDTAPVIDVHGVTKRFGDRTVVRGIDLRVERGEIYGFLGPNGSGKTTFLRMLCGLLTPDGGDGTCLGFGILSDARRIRTHVGYMTQRFSLYEDLTVRENLDFIARIYGVRPRRDAVDQALVDLGLAERHRQLAGQLSGGWKQRLALAACLIHRPRLLLLDEPTAGVDPKARRDFWEQLHHLSGNGITVLITTHYMDEAERCHRLAFIFNGRILVRGSVAEVIAGSKLEVREVAGPDSHRLADPLRECPGVDQVVAFGNTLHVSGRNGADLDRAIAGVAGHGHRTRPIEAGLEDIFIGLMSNARPRTGTHSRARESGR